MNVQLNTQKPFQLHEVKPLVQHGTAAVLDKTKPTVLGYKYKPGEKPTTVISASGFMEAVHNHVNAGSIKPAIVKAGHPTITYDMAPHVAAEHINNWMAGVKFENVQVGDNTYSSSLYAHVVTNSAGKAERNHLTDLHQAGLEMAQAANDGKPPTSKQVHDAMAEIMAARIPNMAAVHQTLTEHGFKLPDGGLQSLQDLEKAHVHMQGQFVPLDRDSLQKSVAAQEFLQLDGNKDLVTHLIKPDNALYGSIPKSRNGGWDLIDLDKSIASLRTINAGAPNHTQAQELIAKLEAYQASKSKLSGLKGQQELVEKSLAQYKVLEQDRDHYAAQYHASQLVALEKGIQLQEKYTPKNIQEAQAEKKEAEAHLANYGMLKTLPEKHEEVVMGILKRTNEDSLVVNLQNVETLINGTDVQAEKDFLNSLKSKLEALPHKDTAEIVWNQDSSKDGNKYIKSFELKAQITTAEGVVEGQVYKSPVKENPAALKHHRAFEAIKKSSETFLEQKELKAIYEAHGVNSLEELAQNLQGVATHYAPIAFKAEQTAHAQTKSDLTDEKQNADALREAVDLLADAKTNANAKVTELTNKVKTVEDERDELALNIKLKDRQLEAAKNNKGNDPTQKGAWDAVKAMFENQPWVAYPVAIASATGLTALLVWIAGAISGSNQPQQDQNTRALKAA